MPVSDLKRYEIYASPKTGGKTSVFVINNPKTTRYTIKGLAKGTYYLNMVSVDKAGLNSSPSSTVTVKVI